MTDGRRSICLQGPGGAAAHVLNARAPVIMTCPWVASPLCPLPDRSGRRRGSRAGDRLRHAARASYRLRVSDDAYAAPFPCPPLVTQTDTSGPERPLTVGICTHERHASLLRCLRSLRHAEGLIDRVFVSDDASTHPVEPVVRAELGDDAPPLTVLRSEQRMGPTPGRNRIARQARTPFILFMDDDAALLQGSAVRDALAVLRADPSVAAVAFAQADGGGRLYPPAAQPSAATAPALVPTFIGFAHLIRTDALLAVGGYREILQINGEERELTLRLLDVGYRVVYLPDAPVAHLADPSGRDFRRYLHLTVRNDALYGLLNEPLPVALGMLPVRLLRYFPMRRHWGGEDPGGFGRVVRAVAQALPRVRRERRAVRWSTLRAWRALGDSPPYHGPGDAP
jgi:GT2 family glycosyltransferase